MAQNFMDKSRKAVEVYNKIAKAYAMKFNQPSEHIDEFINLLDGQRKVLDVGCGAGIDASYLCEKGCDVIGIDLSIRMLEIARRNVNGAKFKVADMRNLNFQASSFDGVFMAYSLIHMPKQEVKNVLSKAHRLLKRKGVMYVAVQTGKSKEIIVPEPLDSRESIFLNIFSKDEMERAIKKEGFSIIKVFERDAKKPGEFNFNKLFVLAHK